MRETSLDDFIGGADEDEADEQEVPDGVEADVVEADEAEPEDQTAEESTRDESDGGDPAESEAAEAELRSEPDSESATDSNPEPVEPAVSTYDWTPTGADCEACGGAVEKRWRDDGRLVCADCKAW